MTRGSPTILATSGGFVAGGRTFLRPGPLLDYAVELAQPEGDRVNLCFVGTALGDQTTMSARLHDAYLDRPEVRVTVLNLFPMPNVDDIGEFLLTQDVVWVGGGSVANLLAVWRVHAVGVAMQAAWQAGVVLGGVSAGSICWHVGGTTDSFGPKLAPVTNGLGLLPYGNGVHYDSESERRPLLHHLVGNQTLPTSYATDDGVGLLYRGTELVEALSERDNAGAYLVERGRDGEVVETRIEPRRLR